MDKINYIIALIGFALAFLSEIKTDYNVIKNELRLFKIERDPFEKDKAIYRSRKWHRSNFWTWVILGVMNILIADELTYRLIYLLSAIGSMRIFLFSIGLNLKRDLDWWHVGDKGIESLFKGKEKIYYTISFIVFIVSIFLIFIDR